MQIWKGICSSNSPTPLKLEVASLGRCSLHVHVMKTTGVNKLIV